MAASGNKIRYWAGAALLAAAAAFVLLVFTLLGRTDVIELWLSPTVEDDMGWQWEVWQDGQPEPVQPVFPDRYIACLPARAALAVRGRTVLPEFAEFARLSVAAYGSGVELFLDGELLYSDFQTEARDAAGFLLLNEAQRAVLAERSQRVQIDLPADYAGRELTLVRYYPEPQADPQPVCPVLCSDETVYAVMVTSTVPSVLMAGVWALLALTILAVFVLDIANGSPDRRSLLLALYFLMLFVDAADDSAAGAVSLLHRYLGPTFLAGLYAVPLQLYLASLFKGWQRWLLCAATLLWAGYEGWQMFASVRAGNILVHLAGEGRYAFLLMLVIAAVFAAEALRRRRSANRWGPVFALWLGLGAVRVLYGSLEFDGDLPAYLRELAMAFAPDGNCLPLLSALMDATAAAATVLLVFGVVHRTLRARRTVEVLRERARQTQAGYERMLQAEEATNAARHEMRHHMTALAGLLQQGDAARAREYLAAMSRTLDSLPAMRYSENVLVNAVAGAYLDAAKAQGIRVECSLQIPAELPIADEDLSVFLTNMLENALQACGKLGSKQERFIRLKMALHESFLFIGCANSAPDEQEADDLMDGEQRAARQHGYGLVAMRQIAEKYSSMLLTELTDGVFSVKSNFSLKLPVKA